MPQKFSQKVKNFLLLWSFIFLGLLYPASHASAFWKELGEFFVSHPLSFGIWFCAKLAIWLAGLAGSLLNWVLSPGFISFSYTNPADNPIIDVGLGITRGFVNMLLVLILVYIAIATILRLAGYETQKLLIVFIIVALLVNFSPVLCGLIVDASNIVMNFFVQDLGADAFGKTMRAELAEIADYNWTSRLETTILSRLFQVAILVSFLLVLIFILLTFTLIFILRHLAIWVLVILSPLAFACYILPVTKKYWDLWWKQLIAWSFIGVTCGFFLYLGLLFVTHVPAAVPAPTTGQGGLFDSILPFFVSTVFLGIGVVFGLQTAAMGATNVMNIAKTKGRAVVRRGGRGVRWVGGRIKERGVKPTLEAARLREATGWISRGWEKAPVARWFLPEKFRAYGQMRPAIMKAQEKAKTYSSRTLAHRILKRADTQTNAAGNLLEIIERGDAEDLFNEARKLDKFKELAYQKYAEKTGKKVEGFSVKDRADAMREFTDQDILESEAFRKRLSRPLQIGARGGILTSKFLRSDPRLAEIAAGKNWAGSFKDMTKKQAVQEATREARRTNINQMEREVFENETVVETMMEKGREVPEAVVVQVKKGQETMQKTIDILFSEYIDNVLSKTNAKLAEKIKNKEPRALDIGWETYREYFKGEHQNRDGYFKYLEGQRAKEMGWRKGEYKSPKERVKGPELPASIEVLKEAGETPPTPAGRRPGGETPPRGRPAGGTKGGEASRGRRV